MSGVGAVVFKASDGYDPDVWDDTALIQEYDRAIKSSRELARKRQERTEKGKKKDWQIGDACRAVYVEDGEEYEGTIVYKNSMNRSVTVRFHGYNNEEEVKERDLMDSLGTLEINEQLEQARLDEEAGQEEEGAGDDFQTGDWCRAEWSEDGVVYEGVIESIDRKTKTALIKFIGFGNKEDKPLDELFMSKGEEWRSEQECNSRSMENGQEEELHNLIAQNCPDLLANFGASSVESGLENFKPFLEDPSSKGKKEKKKKGKSSHSKTNASTDDSSHNTQEMKPPSSWPQSSGLPFPNMHISPFPNIPTPYSMPQFPPIPSMPPLTPSTIMPPPLNHIDAQQGLSNTSAMHSMLLSWYMAGYHTGYYEGINRVSKKKDKK